METKKVALILSILAGSICVSFFIYKLAVRNETDVMILSAGLLVFALGYSSFSISNKGQ
jgi:ABC-type uncharacterized transport system permease subunit